ncbi:MAG TPA: DUF4397 domain-containing protein [Chloroflexota bacterium]|jgi:hypothetical protein|nr:DUF4397 domain-containing protein [Chloroflexota bacterium]
MKTVSRTHAAALVLSLAAAGACALPRTGVQAQSTPAAFVNFLNAAPGAPAGAIFVDGAVRVKSLAFAHPSRYLPLPAGTHRVQAFPAGTPYTSTGGVINVLVALQPGRYYTLVGAGTPAHFQGLLVTSPAHGVPGKAQVGFVDLVQDAPPVDIAVHGVGMVFANISFGQPARKPIAIPAGAYTAVVSPAGQDSVKMATVPLHVAAGQSYTVYALGRLHGAGGAPHLRTVITSYTPARP